MWIPTTVPSAYARTLHRIWEIITKRYPIKLEKFMKAKQPQKQIEEVTEVRPFLRWNYKSNEETGEKELDSITLSDKSTLTVQKLTTAIKDATGTSDLVVGEKILNKVARGMTMEESGVRLNEVS